MYNPQTKLLDGIRLAFPAQLFPWDDYFPRMAETDLMLGRDQILAAKSFFIRQTPFGGSYGLLGGITAALRELKDLRFDDPAFAAGMAAMGYNPTFIESLKNSKHLRLKVYAAKEGAIIFQNEPAVTWVGPLRDVRLAEGIFIQAQNFPTLSLTKWHRLVRAAHPGKVLEFSRRRSQDHLRASLYGMLAGCFATSNSELIRFFDFLLRGTMGHEFLQSFGDIPKAFDEWLRCQPGRAIGLVDTLNCLKHDFPAWLDAVYNHREAIKAANPPLWAWRNDSGDLSYLTIEQYVAFFGLIPNLSG